MKKSIQKVLVVLLAVVMSVTFLVPGSYVKASMPTTDDFNEFDAWSPTLSELKSNAKQVDLIKNYQVKLKPGDIYYYKFKIHRKGNYRVTYTSNDIHGYTKFYMFNKKLVRRDSDVYVCAPNDPHYLERVFSTEEYYIVFRSLNGTGTFDL